MTSALRSLCAATRSRPDWSRSLSSRWARASARVVAGCSLTLANSLDRHRVTLARLRSGWLEFAGGGVPGSVRRCARRGGEGGHLQPRYAALGAQVALDDHASEVIGDNDGGHGHWVIVFDLAHDVGEAGEGGRAVGGGEDLGGHRSRSPQQLR